ncbi:DUF2975 domain-containing protein [Paraliobacillus sp. JSM ZJ581]|uniref:DUF2975 domain-containing protein n=1 Tax=Paraliobacillus sp. JSM ZJ581 TaxID=3342118 RepID=UPI0035A8D7CF
MKNKRKILIFGLFLHIVLMLVFTIYTVWRFIDNSEFNYNNEMVVMSSSLQVKVIIFLLLTSATIVYSLYLMIRLIKNLEKDKIFNKENIKLMERIVRSLVVFSLLAILGISINGSFSIGFSRWSIQNGVLDFSGFNLNFSVFIMAILSIIIIIIAMVEVFKEGLNLKEENDLTV